MSANSHNETLLKRKNRKKGNVSIHQFDEATKKVIKDTMAEQELSKSQQVTSMPLIQVNQQEEDVIPVERKFESVPMIDDHFKQKPLADDSPDLNDREETPLEVEFHVPQIQDEEVADVENDEEDNILRGRTSQVSIDMKNDDEDEKQDYTLINKFFEFLDESDQIINETLSGYFCKVLLVVISH